jgi:outer membrane lipoprotein-sorting protein
LWDNRECHKVIISNPHFKYVDYTVKAGEDLNSIGKSKGISEYMILEKNPTIKDYDNVKAKQVIKIPTDYALKLIFYLDKKTLMPLVIKVYDEVGLYEEYKYSKLVINPKFDAQEFTKSYNEYKF